MKNMKAIIQHRTLYILVLITFFATACKKEFMDVAPPDKISADLVWTDPALAQAFVNDIYNGLSSAVFLNKC